MARVATLAATTMAKDRNFMVGSLSFGRDGGSLASSPAKDRETAPVEESGLDRLDKRRL
jgi:hypothetical protein